MDAISINKFPDLPENMEKFPILHIPRAWNYGSIDAIIFSLVVDEGNCAKRSLQVIPVQITINNRHADSEFAFFTKWNKFRSNVIGDAEFDEIEIVFLWIVEDPSTFPRKDELVAEQAKQTRNGRYTFPRYRREVRSIRQVSEKVGNKLSLARTGAGNTITLNKRN
ncbi:hypothetical protein BDZ91DRAFT_803139 [Kalaharituber pfeilii]|nr:hypothetical protein BDZ91DRAFT_803139 [Kalaharituber pfeilii]